VFVVVFNLFSVHALTSRLPPTSPIIVNAVHPGFCKSQLNREVKFPKWLVLKAGELLLARSCEEGSRHVIWASIGTPSSTRDKEDGEGIRLLKGAYIAHCQVEECSDYALSEEGKAVRERIWV
jgi:retinol dehydrogenase 12